MANSRPIGRLGIQGVLPDKLVREILTWLPTKSLMRFKAVSKLWLSTILDPNFAEAHRARERGILILDPDPSPSLGRRESPMNFYYANLDKACGNGSDSNPSELEVDVSLQLSVPKDLQNFGVTNIVNGLVCFYDRNVSKLYNIATREIIELPESRWAYQFCVYHLGFDSANKYYKLLKICPIYVDEEKEYFHEQEFIEEDFVPIESIECEILTLGIDSSWRSINPPPCAIRPHCLHVNGILYWKIPTNNTTPTDYLHMAFNLTTEKFQSIYEGKVDDLVQYAGRGGVWGVGLWQFGTRVGVVGWDEDRVIVTRHYSEKSGLWTEMRESVLPYTLRNRFGDCSVEPRGALPNGTLVIYDVFGVGCGINFIYLFDETKRDLQKIVFRNSAMQFGGRITLYEENIISLRHLIQCRRPGDLSNRIFLPSSL